jgi:lipoprotein NlpD
MAGLLRIAVLVLLALASLTACNKSWSPEDSRYADRSGYEMTQDGYYRVRRGDSLHAIAFNFGLDWRDIARWNNIGAPYVIYPDQMLRVSEAPPRRAVTTTGTGPAPSVSERSGERAATTTPSQAAGTRAQATPAPQPSASTPVPATTTPPVTKPAVSAAKPPAAGSGASTADPSRWLWPTDGRLLSTFKAGDPSRNGIELAGSEGQPILASAAGEVVYSGNGLIGYGELIIIKHSDRMLSAYGHNRKRLVAEGQAVSAGEKIAEMGRDERNRALLHFEIRRGGTPQDPMKYLPRR